MDPAYGSSYPDPRCIQSKQMELSRENSLQQSTLTENALLYRSNLDKGRKVEITVDNHSYLYFPATSTVDQYHTPTQFLHLVNSIRNLHAPGVRESPILKQIENLRTRELLFPSATYYRRPLGSPASSYA